MKLLIVHSDEHRVGFISTLSFLPFTGCGNNHTGFSFPNASKWWKDLQRPDTSLHETWHFPSWDLRLPFMRLEISLHETWNFPSWDFPSWDLKLPLMIHLTCPSTWWKGNKSTDSNVKTYEILIEKIANSSRKHIKRNGKYIQVVSSCEAEIFYPPDSVTRNSEDWTF